MDHTAGRPPGTPAAERQDSEIRASGSIDDILQSRYGERGGRKFVERQRVRETYLAIDVRLASGEYRGCFYHDLDGNPVLDAAHTTLTVPFRSNYLVIGGHRLLALYRSLLHHSLDIVETTPHAELAASEGTMPVIASIEIIERKEGKDIH